MKECFSITLIVLLWSCQEKTKQTDRVRTTLDTAVVDTIQVDTTPDTRVSMPIADDDTPSSRPTKNFIKIVRFLDSLGYTNDTARVNKFKNYQELIGCEVRFFETFAFYQMDKTKTKVLWWNTIALQKSDSIEAEIFKEAKSVWGYFYRRREDAQWVVDGIIEQWEFDNEQAPRTALENIKLKYPWPYFNTSPYYHAQGRYLFIFHTRADAFSYRQKKFFNKFLQFSSRSQQK